MFITFQRMVNLRISECQDQMKESMFTGVKIFDLRYLPG